MLTKKSNTVFVAAQYIDENGFILMSDCGVDCDVNSELTISEVIEEVVINFDETEEERITLKGDIDINSILLKLQQALTKLSDLGEKIKPYFEISSLVENTQEILANQFGMETIKPKSNYEKILEAGDHLCNLPPEADHSDIFRALTLFVWWDRLRNLNDLDLTEVNHYSNAEVLQAIFQTFPITKEDRKMVKTRTAKEYHYSLYLKVQPFLIRWYSVANADPSNTFVPYNHNLYEDILENEEFYCNLGELAPINEYFRAYWLFMWFEKRAFIPVPRLDLGTIPKDKILKYLDTRFSIKHLKEGSTKQDYFYQLYLQVKPYLVNYFSLEKFEQEELFTYEI